MSLNAEERSRTAAELRANLAATGLGEEAARRGSGLDAARWRAALTVDDARPEDVWLVRDHLESLVLTAGRVPIRFTVLTEDMRAAASSWFPDPVEAGPCCESTSSARSPGTRTCSRLRVVRGRRASSSNRRRS